MKALQAIAETSSDQNVIKLAKESLKEFELVKQCKSEKYNYRESSLIKIVLENPWHPNITNESAKQILELYKQGLSKVESDPTSLDYNCVTAKELGIDVYRNASVKQKAEWSLATRIKQTLDYPRLHAKSRVETIYNAAKYISNPNWLDIFED